MTSQNNRRSKGAGLHLVTLRNISCMHDEVMMYAAAFEDLPRDEQIVISSLAETDSNILKAKFADKQMQWNIMTVASLP